MCVCMHAHMCHGLYVDIKGQFEGVVFLLTMWIFRLNSCCQTYPVLSHLEGHGFVLFKDLGEQV